MSFSQPNYCTESIGVHQRLIFNTTDTSELRTAELCPKGVRSCEVLLYFSLGSEPIGRLILFFLFIYLCQAQKRS